MRYFAGQFLKLRITIPDSFNVGANRPIGGFKEKNWLARLHRHWDQTSMMLEQ
jgi:hypothetical protein